MTILDEVAAWEGDKGLKQYEVMKSAMGARPESLLIACTTAGYVSDGIYDELMNYEDFTDEENLVVLCDDCHYKVHYSDDHELSPYRWESATTIENA